MSEFLRVPDVLGEVSAVLGGNTVESERILLASLERDLGMQVGRARMYLEFREHLSPETRDRALGIARERARGASLQYLLGVQDFLDHEYEVNPNVLIPRPETEILVREVLRTYKDRRPEGGLRGAEIGLGSGVISIELLANRPDLRMTATEVCAEARSLALRNVDRVLGDRDRLEILAPDSASDVVKTLSWYLEAGLGPLDFLVSNPPYLSPEEAEAEVVRNEPHGALFPAGGDLLLFYREIAANAGGFLRPDGLVFLEIPHERADEIQALFTREGWDAWIQSDLTLRDRVLVAKRVQQ
ncbi:MAG: class I SAM-dependent methyltransferase [Bacteriovoracia bacterium]